MVACELQTYFPSLVLSLQKLTSIEGRHATTGNTSAVRRLPVRISKGPTIRKVMGGEGGQGRVIFEPQEIFFVIKFRV